MILAYHVIMTTYGFWLPNDPRGSWSQFVGAWELFRFGKAATTTSRRSLAKTGHNRHQRHSAKDVLRYPPVSFSGVQARTVGQGFAHSTHKGGVTCLACAILPEHAHLVLARHEQPVEVLVSQLKANATKELFQQEMHPWREYRNRQGRLPF